MCDLNSDLCSRDMEKVPANMLKGVADHVGGYKKTRGDWAIKPGGTLTVPDLNFKRYTVLANMPFQPGDNPEKLMVAQDTDCSKWEMPCEDVVRWLNPAIFDSKRDPAQMPDRVVLPVTGFEAGLVLAGVEGSKVARSLTDLGRLRYKNISLPQNREQRFTNEWKEMMRANTPADMAIDALSSHILSSGIVELKSCFKEPLSADQELLLSLIAHPFRNIDLKENIPDKYTKPISIAVLDTWLDKNHCEFKNKVEFLSEENKMGPNRPVPKECGEQMIAIPPNLADDHGTHVAGLIVSDINEKGILGLNPYAKLKYITVDHKKLISGPYRLNLSDILMHSALPAPLGGKEIRVANISWDYKNQVGGNDLIAMSIDWMKQSTLFVVAAGNEATHYGYGKACGALPACLSGYLENVITVVGLDRNPSQPQLWRESDKKGSNWSQDFSIGAIAENVLSTTYKDYTCRLSGTSQAAPQVTAAASLLYSVYEKYHKSDEPVLLPIRVKNRLIYTSDLFNGLLHQLQGGRLNIDRALETAKAYAVIEKDGERKTILGRLTQFGNPPTDYIKCQLNDGSFKDILRQDLRRMFYDKDRRKYIIFKNSKSGNRDSPLERITDCELITKSHKAIIEEDNGKEVEFLFRDIRDYVSAMF